MARTSVVTKGCRILFILITSLLICTSCSDSLYSRIEFNHPGGSFDQVINTTEERQSFSFLLFSDLHFGRTETGVYWAFDEFYDWLDTYTKTRPLDFALHLGDGTAYSLEMEYLQYAAFMQSLEERSIPTYAILGNHDVRSNGRSLFTQHINPLTSRRFSHNGLSFYLLDTGNTSLGKKQLDNLMEAAASDPNTKIFCGHVPLYGGPDMFYFALRDPQERALLLQTMVNNNVGLYLGGHLHLTHKLYRYTDTTHEFVSESFHGRDSLFENTLPIWYVLDYDAPSHQITITRYAFRRDNTIEDTVVATLPLP
ncbi:MAG TPA: metallophosphoesterase [Sphaerochaeta sp.]|nr:metallophosphoesterase [Sphaerochaeta sp.]